MEEVKKKHSKKKIIINIIFYTVMALFYIFVIFGVISRFNNGAFYIFGNRYDVVLSNSMATVDPVNKDFLEGTERLHRNDLIKSEKINDNTELNLKDIVLFNNPYDGNRLTVHRIVRITEIGDKLEFGYLSKTTIEDKEYLNFTNEYSSIISSRLQATSVTISSVSKLDVTDPFICRFGETPMSLTVSKEKIGEYYHYETTFSRGVNNPIQIYIFPKNADQYISSVKYLIGGTKDINLIPNEVTIREDGSGESYYNFYYQYTTRGDANSSDDGKFLRSDFIAKFNHNFGGIGLVVKFMTSIFGIITFALLAVIISVGSYFYNKTPNHKKENQVESEPKNSENTIEKIDNNKDNSNKDNKP